jgi:hypothetical protein
MTHVPPSGSKDSCLCGSGRLFSACCASASLADIAAWQRARETERRLVRRISEFAISAWGLDMLRAAVHEFSIGRHSADSLQSTLPMFDPWFTFTWIPNHQDDYMPVPENWPTVPLALAWLASGSAAVSDFDRAFIMMAADSPYTCLLVETVRPGWSLTARDLMTGRRFRLVDPEISGRARPEDIVFSAVLTLGSASTLVGAAADAIPSDCRFELRETRLAVTGAPWLMRAELMGMEWEVRDVYREALDRRPASELYRGGDASEPLHLSWTVAAPYVEMIDRLRPLTVCFGDEEAIDDEDGPEGDPHMLMTWYERGPSADPDDWQMIGYLYLEEGHLAADVPTPALAARLVAEVTARVGAAATLVDTRPCLPTRVHARKSALFESL